MSIIHLFEGKEVRFVGTWENPEWVAADVIAILYPNAQAKDRANYLATVPKKWTGMKKIHIRSGNGVEQARNMVTLFEPGLHRFISRSDSPLALPFQEWLFEEVIPSIRKTGSYSIAPPPQPVLEPIDLLNLDDRTQHLLEAMEYYFRLGSMEAAWDAYNEPGDVMEGWASPAEVATLDDRLKRLTLPALIALNFFYRHLYWTENRELVLAAMNQGDRTIAVEIEQLQVELDRIQLAPSTAQQQISGN